MYLAQDAQHLVVAEAVQDNVPQFLHLLCSSSRLMFDQFIKFNVSSVQSKLNGMEQNMCRV